MRPPTDAPHQLHRSRYRDGICVFLGYGRAAYPDLDAIAKVTRLSASIVLFLAGRTASKFLQFRQIANLILSGLLEDITI